MGGLSDACQRLHRLGPIGVGENHAVTQPAADVSGSEIFGLSYDAPASNWRTGRRRLLLHRPCEVSGDGGTWRVFGMGRVLRPALWDVARIRGGASGGRLRRDSRY